jgi:hypothetical protein
MLLKSWFVLIAGFGLARGAPTSGIYRINSGEYKECCGIAGQLVYALPNQNQAFLQLTIDFQNNLAGISFLRSDTQTVFHTTSGFTFSFTNGVVFPDHIQFGDPALPPPKPGQPSVSYTVSNSASGLQINGTAIQEYVCCDIPNEFAHTNVLATLLRNDPKPSLGIPRTSTKGMIGFTIWNGQAGQTNVIEASTELIHWDAISTNVFPPTLCPTCPFIDFEDTSSTNFPRRFYRCYTIP